METRKRAKIDYNENSTNHFLTHITIDNIESTSKWNAEITQLMNIEVCDDVSGNSMFKFDIVVDDAVRMLYFPEWKDEKWLENVNITALNVNNKIKTLIQKIKRVYTIISKSVTEMYVDGFMDSLLHLMYFDDFPCMIYPQYEYSAKLGYNNHEIVSKSDFGIISESSKLLLVIEDKTVTNATYANNWKEDQVLGELFVAVHNIAANHKITYPIQVYAIRVVGTLFTFYKATATLDYIKETARHLPNINKMTVQRHPLVNDDPSGLTAYNFCTKNDRESILKYMFFLREFICA